MAGDDEFTRLAAEYAANHHRLVHGVPVPNSCETPFRPPLLGLRRALFTAMGGAETKAATLADGTVVRATVRGWGLGVFLVEVEPPPAGVIVTDGEG